ncbi:DUF4145 domain-containing protein [Variovorax sp. J2P1-59]|uniref:DUF4145 domain-containing protein n=1 Tax=Variovorax flavidus TaxID=3053501 RepID=UPI002577282E|nr:DUF4145 domain-containing protein [Variovorax sp. J2P1-59]MDM0073985.1 DUF4145 domain-containing protein [Variovorax sp. J2P1-59]
MAFIAPAFDQKSFTCPHCGVLTRHYKWGYDLNKPTNGHFTEQSLAGGALKISVCEHCGKNCLWVVEEYVYPAQPTAPHPNADMPPDVRADYEEAARICNTSPRGAAALLRLAIQKLMINLGRPGRNINEDIAALVAKGLPVQIQQALDVVRVVGNNAVHPGHLDSNDIQIAQQLFPLINVIVEYQISLPSRIQEMYNALPNDAKVAIEKRDAGK